MAHSRDRKTQLRRLYVTDRQPLKAAAKMARVSYSTARAWKERAWQLGDDWDHARLAQRLVEGGPQALVHCLLEDVAPYVRSTIEELKGEELPATEKVECISRLADALGKITKIAGLVDPKLATLSIGMDFMRRLAGFTAERFPQHHEAVLEVLEPFGEKLAAEHSR